MSLLAMIADNFELEPPEHCRHRSLEEDEMMQSSSLDYDFTLNDESNNCKSLSQPLLLSKEDDDEHAVDPAANNNNTDGVRKDHDNAKLLLSFFLMLIVGTFNKIFQKLQAIVSYTTLAGSYLHTSCTKETNL
eukprot:scaffold22580_cov61-Cyclotella_meneghiniana.AAC.1